MVRKENLIWIVLAFLFLSLNVSFAQKKHASPEQKEIDLRREGEILKSIVELDKAMVSGDTSSLNRLLYERVRFKHSNGMVESKQELLNNLTSGYLRYLRIEQQGVPKIKKWIGKKGGYFKDHTVTRELHVVGELDGELFDVVIMTTEHWGLGTDGSKWVLAERESVQVNK